MVLLSDAVGNGNNNTVQKNQPPPFGPAAHAMTQTKNARFFLKKYCKNMLGKISNRNNVGLFLRFALISHSQ
jgi:hypothetical protein